MLPEVRSKDSRSVDQGWCSRLRGRWGERPLRTLSGEEEEGHLGWGRV